jgi:Recombination endonuclease VII
MPKATCSDPGCRRQSFARGLCQRHYGIAYRSGTLPPKQPKQLILGEHSLTNVDRDARTADCSICGPQVPIRVRVRTGGGGIECMIKRVESRRQWNRSHRRPARQHSDRKYKRYKKYKLTQDDYDRMVAEQQGCCAICHSKPPVLAIDHDHETGAVRGLLCHKCNIGIGFLRDDIDLLYSAIQYLTTYGSSAA